MLKRKLLGQHRVTGIMGDPALMLFDSAADEVLAQSTVGAFLVALTGLTPLPQCSATRHRHSGHAMINNRLTWINA